MLKTHFNIECVNYQVIVFYGCHIEFEKQVQLEFIAKV